MTSTITWPFESHYVVSYRWSVDTFFLSSKVIDIFWSTCAILSQACIFPLQLAWHEFWVVEGYRGVLPFFNIQRSAAAERRRLNYEPATIIGRPVSLALCFNAAILSALWRCQFGVKWGENRGVHWGSNAIIGFDLNELVLSFEAPKVCAKFRQNWIKIVIKRAGTDTHTQTKQTEMT